MFISPSLYKVNYSQVGSYSCEVTIITIYNSTFLFEIYVFKQNHDFKSAKNIHSFYSNVVFKLSWITLPDKRTF